MEIKLKELEEKMQEGEKITVYSVNHWFCKYDGQSKEEAIANATDLYPAVYTTYHEALEEYKNQPCGIEYYAGSKHMNVRWIEKQTLVMDEHGFLDIEDSEIILSK